jgi:transglutaminase-like putative cysteine protease
VSIHVAIEHTTVYRFDRAVELAPHIVRLRPAPQCRTPVLAYSLTVEPSKHFLNWQQDPFGNHLARLVFPDKARELRVTVELIADLTVINPFDFFLDEDAEHIPFPYDEELARDLAPYLEVVDAGGPLVDAWVADLPRTAERGEPWRTNDFLVTLNQRLADEIAYNIRMEPGVQTPEETMEKRRGSCRDTAWLLVQLLRRLGLAARFVSGYLVQLTADIPAFDGPSGPVADFTDLHAWTEVYVPGAGWIGLDPTSGLFAGEGHIPLACTPSPGSAAPITGSTEPCEVAFEYANVVTRLHEDPRVTLPYSDEQWAAIDALGREVDRRLAAADVRLTQGGEPSTGGQTGSRCGGTVSSRPTRPCPAQARVTTPPGSRTNWRRPSASNATICCRRSRTRCTSSGKRPSATRARRSPGTRSQVGCFHSTGATRGRGGRRVGGVSAAASCTSSPVTRPSGCGCRSGRSTACQSLRSS